MRGNGAGKTLEISLILSKINELEPSMTPISQDGTPDETVKSDPVLGTTLYQHSRLIQAAPH